MNESNRAKLVSSVYESYSSYLAAKSDAPLSVHFDELISNIFTPGPTYYYILDSPTLTFERVSKSGIDILGFNITGFSLEKFLSILHLDDFPFMLNCENRVANFIKTEIPTSKILKYKFSYCVREQVANGEYKLFLVQNMAISINDDGALLKVLGIHSDISGITQINNYRLSFVGLEGEPSFRFQENAILDRENPIFPLVQIFTNRELQVIQLLSTGLTSKEIAHQLCLSTHTIDSHKKNAMKKADSKNTTELIVYCVKYGLI